MNALQMKTLDQALRRPFAWPMNRAILAG